MRLYLEPAGVQRLLTGKGGFSEALAGAVAERVYRRLCRGSTRWMRSTPKERAQDGCFAVTNMTAALDFETDWRIGLVLAELADEPSKAPRAGRMYPWQRIMMFGCHGTPTDVEDLLHKVIDTGKNAIIFDKAVPREVFKHEFIHMLQQIHGLDNSTHHDGLWDMIVRAFTGKMEVQHHGDRYKFDYINNNQELQAFAGETCETLYRGRNGKLWTRADWQKRVLDTFLAGHPAAARLLTKASRKVIADISGRFFDAHAKRMAIK